MGLELALIPLGALAGGFVCGMTGFGTGLTAMAFWLHVIGPALAAPLVIICSVIAQVQNLPRVWNDLDPRRLWPFVAGGIIGVPIGARLLTYVDPATFKAAVGVLLIGYSAGMLFLRPRLGSTWGGWPADGLIGLGGGFLGGLAGLSGPLPTIWAAIRGWGKAERRGVFQAFNLAILSAAMLAYAANGILTAEIGRLVLVATPGTLIGAWAGFLVYQRLNDQRFHEVVLYFLTAAGVVLLLTS